jgi:hypothetical protein
MVMVSGARGGLGGTSRVAQPYQVRKAGAMKAPIANS